MSYSMWTLKMFWLRRPFRDQWRPPPSKKKRRGLEKLWDNKKALQKCEANQDCSKTSANVIWTQSRKFLSCSQIMPLCFYGTKKRICLFYEIFLTHVFPFYLFQPKQCFFSGPWNSHSWAGDEYRICWWVLECKKTACFCTKNKISEGTIFWC